MTEQQPPNPQQPPEETPRTDAAGILRRLQGEDGYDIFSDTHTDDHLRWHREYEADRR